MKRSRVQKIIFRLCLIIPFACLTGIVGYKAYCAIRYFTLKNFAPQSIIIKCENIYSQPLKSEIENFVINYLSTVDYFTFDVTKIYKNLKERFKVIKKVSWKWDHLEQAEMTIEGVRPEFRVNKKFVFGKKRRLLPKKFFDENNANSLKTVQVDSSLIDSSGRVKEKTYEFLKDVPGEYLEDYELNYSGKNRVLMEKESDKKNIKFIVDDKNLFDCKKVGQALRVHEDFVKLKGMPCRAKKSFSYDLRFKNRIYAKASRKRK